MKARKYIMYILTLLVSTCMFSTALANSAMAASMVGPCTYSYDYTEKLAAKLPAWKDPVNKILITRITLVNYNNETYDAFYVMTPSNGGEKLNVGTSGQGGYPSLERGRGGPGSFLLLLNSNGSQFEYDTGWSNERSGTEPLLCVTAQQNVTYTSEYLSAYDEFPSMPSVSPYTGTVDCMDTEPPAQMLIYQIGNSGSATLTVSSMSGKADWAYDFTDDPYHIAVLCGTKWTYSYGTVTEKNANWYCNPYGEYLKECQLG